MEEFKHEIYICWEVKTENFINSLLNSFSEENDETEVHVFLYENKFEVERRLRSWPDNFYFHVAYTTSEFALQTSLITYVFEKFSKRSEKLSLTIEEVTDKNKILFIQKSLRQYEEMKTMLIKMPFLKDIFNFELLALNGKQDSDMLLNALSNSSNEFPDSPRLSEGRMSRNVLHGRRSSNLTINSSSPPMKGVARLTKSTKGNDCKHCERIRGSDPKFSVKNNDMFCLACFLQGQGNVDDGLCKHCLRQKYIEMVDQSTCTRSMFYTTDKAIQVNTKPIVNDACTTMYEDMTKDISKVNVSTQLFDNEFQDNIEEEEEDLAGKFHELIGQIEANQEDVMSPDILLDVKHNGFRLNDVPVNPKTNKYHCPFCTGKLFDKIEVFEVHLKNVHKKCNCSCEQYFDSREDYIEHFYEVFPIPCFISRKCPERFRSVHYQATHHEQEHYADKPYCCIPCYNNGVSVKKVQFRDVFALEMHAEKLKHSQQELGLSIQIGPENEQIPNSRRSSAINFSGY